MINVMIIGGGGREHALTWKISLSPLVEKILVVPGNDGMTGMAKVEICKLNTDHQQVIQLAQKNMIDLVVIGPEKPLSEGLVDVLIDYGIAVVGPGKTASKLESSKLFSKIFMQENNIPTARYESFTNSSDAISALDRWNMNNGIVVKTDELAQGKGVVVTHDYDEAKKTILDFMNNPECSVKSDSIIIEEKLSGREVSAFALSDGDTFVPLGYACDYKRLHDGDKGPNTGGMGCYTPDEWPSLDMKNFINERIFKKVVDGMKETGNPYKGIIFAGLMIDNDNINVLEFNVRFGDPEAQVLLPIMEEDIVPLLMASANGTLGDFKSHIAGKSKLKAVHVVMSSHGYPSIDSTPMLLEQKINIENKTKNSHLFFAGVRRNENGDLVNTGGRVLGVTSIGETIDEAKKSAYAGISKIHFNKAHWRKDVGNI
ncbi:MAG: phosphoribosylamine--glycine ligase [Bacteriovoracaceae bacterium]|nr:phosphoribosylamine--glycine ligase [Bacteriovoracaceae bacterium]